MNDIERYLVEEELEHYRDGWITRREFVRRAALLGVGAGAALALARSLGVVSPVRAAPTAQASPFSVAENDPAVATTFISYPSTDGTEMVGYLAWPSAAMMDSSLPGLVICHENRGVTPHFKDVPRRFAKQGYVAIVPDLLSRFGPPTDQLSDDEVRATYSLMDPQQNALDFAAALDFLKGHPAVDSQKLAATGYCFGSGVIWRLATIYPDLKAAVPCYGSNPPLDDAANIRAAVLGVYGELDTRITPNRFDLEERLQSAGVTYRFKVFPNSQHAFFNDTGGAYNPDTAAELWMDTLSWFAEYLGLPTPTVEPNLA